MNSSTTPGAGEAMPTPNERYVPAEQIALPTEADAATEVWIELLVDLTSSRGRTLVTHTVRALEAFIFQGQIDMRVRLDLDDEEESWLIIECQKLEDMDALGQMIAAFDLLGWSGEGGRPPPAYAKPVGSSRDLTGEHVDLFMFRW